MTVKNLDMPEGNGICDTYADMMNYVAMGKQVGVIAVELPNGTKGCFVSAAKAKNPPETTKQAHVHCLSMCLDAQNRAESRGIFPLVRAKLRA